ncbi:MAG: hypothetical protein R2839_06360 [Thermomicrobiales bacterium]
MKLYIGRAIPWLLPVAIISIVSTQLWNRTTVIPTQRTPTPVVGLVAARSIALYALVQPEDVRMTIDGTPIAVGSTTATTTESPDVTATNKKPTATTLEAQATELSQTVIDRLAIEDIAINQLLIVGENLGPRTEGCKSLYIFTVRVIPMTTGLQPGSQVSLVSIATATAGTPVTGTPAAENAPVHAVVMHIGETDSKGYVAVTLATDLPGGRYLAQNADAVFIHASPTANSSSATSGVIECKIDD